MQKYGQHLLINRGIINKIVDCVVDNAQEGAVIEIGPGKGALTLAMLERGLNNFTVVEIDPYMTEILNKVLPDYAEVNIINQDFLMLDLNSLPFNSPALFVSNLPYIDAAEILLKTLNYKGFGAAVYMFQREQARRILAKPETRYYGQLSILAQAQADISSVCRVSAGSFAPPPKVESEVLLFRPKKQSLFKSDAHKKIFEELVKAAFAYRRKTALNALCGHYGGNKDGFISLLKKSGIPVSARAQEIDIRKYLNLGLICNLAWRE
jgi:16S rRNA (adenine1518-N6/adenine1519-N6)-dimethyltransferase